MNSSHISHRGSRDPAESWELPCTEGDQRAFSRGISDVFPSTPRRAEDVTEGALEDLTETCALEGLRQVFTIPPGARSTGMGEQVVMSPESVLGIGTRAVALWTRLPQPGVKVAIPLERLSAIADVTMLLYSRLTFLSLGVRLTIRYNALGRYALQPALVELRRRLAGSPQPLPFEETSRRLPIKWESLLRSPLLRFHEDAPVAFRFATAPRRSRHDQERGQLIAVNAHELVFMCDPPESQHNYGEDSFIVPRPRITRVRNRLKYLEVASNGVRYSLSMAPELREAAARWFA